MKTLSPVLRFARDDHRTARQYQSVPEWTFICYLVIWFISTTPSFAGPLDTWTTRVSTTSVSLNDITYNGTRFVVVGDGGTILTSEDGVQWTNRPSGTSVPLFGIAYGGGLFVATADNSVNPGFVLTSPDGISWTSHNTGINSDLAGVTYGNGQYVAVGGTGRIITSPDGSNWSARISGTGNYLFEVAHGNGVFVAVGGYGPSTSTVLTSTNGIDWTPRSSGLAQVLNGVTFDDGKFVTVGGKGGVGVSTNGINWTAQTVSSGTFTSVRWGPGAYVAVALYYDVNYNLLGFIKTSNDSTTWITRLTGISRPLMAVSYGAGHFVVVGWGGRILQSDYTDPIRLTPGIFSPATGFALTLTGEPGLACRLQTSDEIAPTAWTDLLSFTLAQGSTNLVDSSATNHVRRFYRIVSP